MVAASGTVSQSEHKRGLRGSLYFHLKFIRLDANAQPNCIEMADELDTNRIKDWRSIITLIVFVLASKALAVCSQPV